MQVLVFSVRLIAFKVLKLFVVVVVAVVESGFGL